jgi:hypothetical protein
LVGAGDSVGLAQTVEDALKDTRGVRSAFYSLFVYITSVLSGGSAGAVVIQSGVTAWLSLLLIRCAFPMLEMSSLLIIMTVLALGTTASWMASYLMPDLFAAVAILTAALLTFYRSHLSLAVKLLVALLFCGSITVHASHLPLAAGLLLIAPLISRIFLGTWRGGVATLSWLAIPIVLAVGAIVTVGIVGFKTVSLAPASPPFVLARAIKDGPAYRYIKEMCPRDRFAVCAFSEDLQPSAFWFLWAPDGAMERASPEVRHEIRRQEMEVVWAAVRAYPLEQLRASANNLFHQLGDFALHEFWWGSLDFSNPRHPQPPPRESGGRAFFAAFSAIHYVVVVASVVVLVGASLRRSEPLPREHLALIVFVVLGILGNDAICSIFSGPADRYQSRVIWLLPLLATPIALMLFSSYSGRRIEA